MLSTCCCPERKCSCIISKAGNDGSNNLHMNLHFSSIKNRNSKTFDENQGDMNKIVFDIKHDINKMHQ